MRTILLVAALLASRPMAARACSTCGCGDPTLTAMGTEKPFAGRLRASLELRVRSLESGTAGVDRQQVSEERLDLAVAYAPSARLIVAATAPLVRRQLDDVSLARDVVASVGDLDVRAKLFLLRDREFSPRHLLSLVAGAKLPTAPRLDAPSDAQTGTGSVDPLFGLSYGGYFDTWKLFASSTLSLPIGGWGGERPGPALRASAAAQLQPGTSWALTAGADTRLEAATRQDGADQPDSGGFIAFAALRVAWMPVMDLLIHAGVSVPVVSRLNGHQRESAVAMLGVAYDF